MEKKCQVDDRVSFSSDISHGYVSSTGKNKTSPQTRKESEVSAISSEQAQSAQQTSSRSDLSSEAGHPVNKIQKDPDVSRTEVSQEQPTKTVDMLQFNSVDSSDPKHRQSSNENTADKKPCTKQEVSGRTEQDSSHASNKHKCEFDLNEDTEDNNRAGAASEPIPVVAKVGVPIGLPRKPLQFGGELGFRRRSATLSAFRPTVSKTSFTEKNVVSEPRRQSLASQGIDLNIAATIDSELCTDENFMGVGPNSGFDLNFNPAIEDTPGKHIRQISETRELSKSQDAKRHPSSYWVDLRSMPGFNHPQSRPFLVAGPTTAEQVRMVVPIQSDIPFLQHGPSSRVHIDRVHSISPAFYPHAILPLQQPVVPHLSGSVIAAYPGGALHVIDGPQVLFPAAAYATAIRPAGAQNGAKRREPDGGWDYSQVNYRPMASWK